MAKELEVTTTVELNKQDVVTVAMARIEMHVSKKVREAKARIDELISLIADANKEIEALSKAGIPKAMKTKQEKLDKGIQAAGVKDIDINILVSDNRSDRSTEYTLIIVGKGNHVFVEKSKIDYTKAQIKLIDNIKAMEKQKQ